MQMPYESMHQSSAPNGMLDSLSLQLRDAETRRSEIERAHQVSFVKKKKIKLYEPSIFLQYFLFFLQETLAQIRNLSSSGRTDTEAIENLQSRARELEKKVYFIEIYLKNISKLHISDKQKYL